MLGVEPHVSSGKDLNFLIQVVVKCVCFPQQKVVHANNVLTTSNTRKHYTMQKTWCRMCSDLTEHKDHKLCFFLFSIGQQMSVKRYRPD